MMTELRALGREECIIPLVFHVSVKIARPLFFLFHKGEEFEGKALSRE